MLGPKLAVVLRAKSGDNFLVQTHGIPGKVVQESATDALESLSRFSKDGAKAGLHDGSGDATPDFALGMLPVLQGRYLVTYRLVNSILLLIISEASTNAFLCLRTLDAATKILVGACKSIEVTAERLSKRYADVHAFLGGIISGGLASLPPSFVHTSATNERLLAVPLSASDAARRLRKLMAAGGKTSAFAPTKQQADSTADPSAPAVQPGSIASMPDQPDTPTTSQGQEGGAYHRSAASADPLASIEFGIPSDALPPPPARAVGAKRRPPAPPRAIQASVAPPAFEGAMQGGTENRLPAEAEGFGAFEEVKLMKATPADANQSVIPGTDQWAADFSSDQKQSEKRPVGPSLDDLKQALQLVEIWHAEVTAGKLIKAGVVGEVRRRLAPYGLTAARFRTVPSPILVVNACLQTASRHKTHSFPAAGAAAGAAAGGGGSTHSSAIITTTTNTTIPSNINTMDANSTFKTEERHGDLPDKQTTAATLYSRNDEFSFHAILSGVPITTSYLKYSLPSVACDPPLQVDLLVAPPSGVHVPGKPARTAWEGLIAVRYVVNPSLHGALIDVVVDVDFAPDIPTLKRISPAGKWSKEQCRIRWSLGTVKPGESGCCRAIVQAREGTSPERAEECLRRDTVARVAFTGWPGRSISGVGFEVGMPLELKGGECDNGGYHAGRIVTFGDVLVRAC